MDIKTTQPVHVMYKELTTNLKSIRNNTAAAAGNLYAEAEKLGLKVSGPQQWVYYGASGDPDREFKLQICLPVEGEASSADFQFQTLPELKHVHTNHLGAWDDFGDTYNKVFAEVHSSQLQPNNEVREVYLNVDMDNPDANVTEIQVGVA